MTTNQKGMFEKFHMWYNPNGIANVISLKTMTEHYHVTYDSDDSNDSDDSDDRWSIHCTHPECEG